MQSDERSYFGGTDEFMTLRHLVVKGTNFEIGRKMAEIAIQRYGLTPNQLQADPRYSLARRQYLQHNYPIQLERVRGAAAAFGLTPEDDRFDLTNLMYNLGLELPLPGCSVVYYPPSTTATGRGYLSRNYDFSIGTVAEILNLPVSLTAPGKRVPVMSEPYLLEAYPEDGGYASIAVHAFDLLSGTLDGLNSAGLVVSILADEEAIARLGPDLEFHFGAPRAVGLHELQVMRYLLDTCATAAEARQKLLMVKQHYAFVPCHYIIADLDGDSFIYENSTGRNFQHILDGGGKPQVVTNFQVHRHPNLNQMPAGPLTFENNAFWRYRQLVESIAAHSGPFTIEDIKGNNACVSVMQLFEVLQADPAARSIAAGFQARTLWHSLYDQHSRSVEISFYLGEEVLAGGMPRERRSDYISFGLRA